MQLKDFEDWRRRGWGGRRGQGGTFVEFQATETPFRTQPNILTNLVEIGNLRQKPKIAGLVFF